MTPANHRFSRVILSAKDNTEFALPEPVYVHTNVIKPNLGGDSYFRLLTSLHFPSGPGYHRFHYPLYKSVEQSFIESITNRLVTNTDEDVVFEDSDISCLVILTWKRSTRCIKFQFDRYNGSIYTLLRGWKWWWLHRSRCKGEMV
jgi:hypothetical protein